MADLAWWQRSNYEDARQRYHQHLGLNTLPFRIQVDRADLKLKILPKNFSKDSVEMIAGPNTQIESVLRLRCNRIPLQLQGLATFTDTVVSTPVGDVTLQRLTIGDRGGVHLIAQPHEPIASALNVITPYSLPRLPLGWDATGNYLAYDEVGRCYTPEEIAGAIETCSITDAMYENLCAVPYTFDGAMRASGLKDWTLTDRLPVALLESDGKLPHDWELEALLSKLLGSLSGQQGSTETKPFSLAPLQLLEKFIQPGSRATLEVASLNDLFIPGLLDLGNSTGTLQVEYGSDGALWLQLHDLDIHGDPMDYPAGPTGQRPPIHLQSFRLSSGEARTNSLGETLVPGLRLHVDPKGDRISMEANLSLQIDVELPWLGKVQVAGQLLASGAVHFSKDGMHFRPGENHWEIRDLDLRQAGELVPLLETTQVILSDRTPADPITGIWPLPIPGLDYSAPLRLTVNGQTGLGYELHIQSRLPVPLDVLGAYQFENWFETFFMEANLNLWSPEGTESGAGINLNRSHLSWPTQSSTPARPWELQVDLWENQGQGPTWLLHQGKLTWQWNPGEEADGSIQDLSLNFTGQEANVGELNLRQINGALKFEWANQDLSTQEWRIPEFHLAADASKNRHGPLRGPLSLQQRPGKTLSIAWSPEDRRLAWQNLDLKIDAQKLDLVPRRVRRAIHPRIRFIGLDARLAGDFTLELPEDRKAWRGRGKLSIKGDRRGDLYWLDRYGRQVGPPLVRETRWHMRRIRKINWRRAYALGSFHLDTIINPASFLPQADWTKPPSTTRAYGHRGQALRPFEIQAIMPYDNQPWSQRGFQRRILDYLDQLCRQDPTCRQKTFKKGNTP